MWWDCLPIAIKGRVFNNFGICWAQDLNHRNAFKYLYSGSATYTLWISLMYITTYIFRT